MGLYYLQSRYYDPEFCRFLNADAFISTGQGELGNNMFAYCANNPVIHYDPSGNYYVVLGLDDNLSIHNTLEQYVGVGGGFGSILLTAGAVVATIDTLEQGKIKAEILAQKQEESKELYTVYFLCAAGDVSQTIIYVGRVKSKNFASRMKYHKSKGRELVDSIDCLDYSTCRALEQAGMIYFHTINRNSALNNQIRGISPLNGKRYDYMAALWNLINGSSYTGDTIMPISYFANFSEEAFLNDGL